VQIAVATPPRLGERIDRNPARDAGQVGTARPQTFATDASDPALLV
jgi:hypothetical protein